MTNKNYNSTLQSNNIDLQAILDAINELPEAGGSSEEITLQDKTVTPTTSKQTITADSGYDGLDTVTVNAIPSDYVKPSGTKSITENGTHDVKSYASVDVNVTGSTENLDTELDAQEDKLNNLLTILETKASMSLPDLTNEGTAADMFSGKQLIDSDGNVVTGTFTIDAELSTQDSLIAQIQSAIDELPNAGSGGSSEGIETCTVVITNNGGLMGPGAEPVFYYVDQNGTIQQIASVSCTLTVMKNSIMAITNWSHISTSTGQCNQIFYTSSCAAYAINGDSTLTYKGF